MRRVTIGVTWCGDEGRQVYYERAVATAGGSIRRITVADAVRAGEVLCGLQGLLLTGGPDVDPAHYGQMRLEPPALHVPVTVDPARDALELPLVRMALERDLPVLGICRGVQVLNVAAGGDLVQDVKLLGLERSAHDQARRSPPLVPHAPGHWARISPGTRLAAIVGAGRVGVNTFHHQAVGRPAPGLVVAASASDGVVEAIESAVHRFVLGVQWHPERMAEREVCQQAIFEALVLAAGQT
ncbi:MAG: gamma-glutamyl-gamma-aminobutyrate hydrolase family protein [Armatimonadota bacterium]|nr:gamma-glutamyl-gamma-aminobutyrate hydrolase family protein [Armatimonadota bacterium]MDR5697855.1 gamma-glutamyl-gamma-aminobutyrate hydrolase family protein [Armatimonadota bacterium]